ncbi:MAG: hypothetical protein AAFV71_25330 [Cyanobacteria bacterium J06633_8]
MQTIQFKYDRYQLQAIVTPSGKLEFLVPSLITALGQDNGKLGRKLMNGIAKKYKQRRLILSTTLNKPFRQLTIEKDVLLDYCRHNVHIKEFTSLVNFLSNVDIPQIQHITNQDNAALPGSNPLVEELEASIKKSPENGWYYFVDSLEAINQKLGANVVLYGELWDVLPERSKYEPKESKFCEYLISREGLEFAVAIIFSCNTLFRNSENFPDNIASGRINERKYYIAKDIVNELANYFQFPADDKYISDYMKLVSNEKKTKKTIILENDTRYYGWLLTFCGVESLAISFANKKHQSLVEERQLNTVVVDISDDYDDFTKIPAEVVFELIDNLEGYPIDFDAAWAWVGYFKKQDAIEKLKSKFEEGSEFLRLTVKTTERGGRPAEKIYLTINCFKQFCIMANTKRGKECRQYLIKCEREYRLRLSNSTNSTTNYTVEQFINKETHIPQLTQALTNQEFYSRYTYETIAQYLTSRKNSFDELWQEFVINPPNLKTAIAWDNKIIKEAARWGLNSQDMEAMHHNTLTATALKKCVKQGAISIENGQTIEIMLREALRTVEPLQIAPKRPKLIQPAPGVNTTPGDKAKELESSKVVELLARKCISLQSKGDTWYKWDDLIKAINQDVDRMESEIENHIWEKLPKSYKRKYRGNKFINKQGIAQTTIIYSGFIYPNSKIEALPEVAEIFFGSKEVLEILDHKKLCCLSKAIRKIDFDGIANNSYISDWVTIDELNKFYVETLAFGEKYQEVYINKLGFVQLIQSYLKRKDKINKSEINSLESQFALLDAW